MNGANTDLIKQIHISRKYGLNGVIIFDYAHLTKTYTDVLTQSVFRNGKYSEFSEEDLKRYEALESFKKTKRSNN